MHTGFSTDNFNNSLFCCLKLKINCTFEALCLRQHICVHHVCESLMIHVQQIWTLVKIFTPNNNETDVTSHTTTQKQMSLLLPTQPWNRCHYHFPHNNHETDVTITSHATMKQMSLSLPTQPWNRCHYHFPCSSIMYSLRKHTFTR